MEQNAEINNSQFTSQEDLNKSYKLQVLKEKIYRFFYNIWPSVQRFFSFIIYHTIRIIKGSVKTALEQLKNNG